MMVKVSGVSGRIMVLYICIFHIDVLTGLRNQVGTPKMMKVTVSCIASWTAMLMKTRTR